MKVRFLSPPPALQIGGIQNAIEGLRAALGARGAEVLDGADPTDRESLHHFHGLWNPGHSRLAGRLRNAGRPYVVSPHGMLEPWAFRNRRWKKLPYFHLVERRFLTGAASLFVTSEMEKEHLLRVVSHPRVEVLPLGCRDPRGPAYAEARRTLGWKRGDRVMVFLSRVDPKKGLHLLFEALAGLPEVARGWRLVIVGDGPEDYGRELRRRREQLGGRLPPVEWIGPVWGDGRWPYLRGGDLFVLPTHSENFGIAVLEALHAGTPVLTTTGTPWREHGERDGIFICDPTIESIRDRMREVIPALDGDQGESARESLAIWAEEHFAWGNLVKQYEAAYAAAIE